VTVKLTETLIDTVPYWANLFQITFVYFTKMSFFISLILNWWWVKLWEKDCLLMIISLLTVPHGALCHVRLCDKLSETKVCHC